MSHLVVGILLQQPLPDIPDFDMYLDHLGADHEEVAKCELISGGSVWLTDGALLSSLYASKWLVYRTQAYAFAFIHFLSCAQMNPTATDLAGEVAKLQTFHCGLLRLLFLATADPDASHCTVTIAAVNDVVKVSITPQRIVRNLGGARMHDSVQRLLDVIMEDYWNFKGPSKGSAEAQVRFPVLNLLLLVSKCNSRCEWSVVGGSLLLVSCQRDLRAACEVCDVHWATPYVEVARGEAEQGVLQISLPRGSDDADLM